MKITNNENEEFSCNCNSQLHSSTFKMSNHIYSSPLDIPLKIPKTKKLFEKNIHI